MNFTISTMIALLKLQSDNWPKKIRGEFRFILCGIFSYFTFSTYELLKGVTVDQQNSLLIAAFGQPSLFVLIFYLVFIGYIGLYCSLISVALFNTLLPKT